MFVFRDIWSALFPCYSVLRFAVLPYYRKNTEKIKSFADNVGPKCEYAVCVQWICNWKNNSFFELTTGAAQPAARELERWKLMKINTAFN